MGKAGIDTHEGSIDRAVIVSLPGLVTSMLDERKDEEFGLEGASGAFGGSTSGNTVS
jgi:hypothetical protein